MNGKSLLSIFFIFISQLYNTGEAYNWYDDLDCQRYTNDEQNVKYKLTKDDIHLGVKTSSSLIRRLFIIKNTWLPTAPKYMDFITDDVTPEMTSLIPREKFVETDCNSAHNRKGLCCKMEAAFKHYLTSESDTKWLCMLDDDVYLNVDNLVELLQCFDPDKNWYIGQESKMKSNDDHRKQFQLDGNITVSFRYAHGQVYCMTRRNIAVLAHIYKNRTMYSKMDLGDDVQLGFINEIMMNVKLTAIDNIFHHNVPQQGLNFTNIRKAVTFSYKGSNRIDVPIFTAEEDPTRFLSAHCVINPSALLCAERYSEFLSELMSFPESNPSM